MTSNHQLLYRLAELMLQHEQHILPVDLLFDDEQIGDFVKSIQIDSPYQQMLLEGVLTESVRDEKLYVSFTVEGYFHYVLGEVIYHRTEGLKAGALKLIVEANKMNGSKEGVEQCLIRDVQKGDLTRLMWLIDESDLGLDLAVLPLAMAFISIEIKDVLRNLLISPSYNDLILLEKVCSFFEIILKANISNEIKRELSEIDNLENLFVHLEKIENAIVVKDQVKLFVKLNINLSDNIKDIQIKKIIDFINFFLKGKSSNSAECLIWISILVDLNVQDKAKKYYENFIENAVKCNDQNALVIALEQLGDSEYKRGGKDGYEAARSALTRAAEIRESEETSEKHKLKNTYRLLGFAYLSHGLQLVKSIEYFEKAKAIMLEESTDSDELAEMNFYIGLMNNWRGLRGIGRWGHADPSLLEGLDIDLFEYADAQFQQAYNYHFKHLGKTHPQTLKAVHYLQENRYAMGNYEQAIPWLRKYVESLPFKTREHTDNFYRYCLLVALEENAKSIATVNKEEGLVLIQEALQQSKNYDESNQIANRLLKVKQQIEDGQIEEIQYASIDELTPLETETNLKGLWSKWEFAKDLKGFQTNSWMVDAYGIWFFNGESKQLVYWNRIKNSLSAFNPSNWPEGFSRLVYDQKNRLFYAWSSIRSTVFELTSPEGNWNRLSYGVHDVHACGASFAFDSVNNRLFEFGGYGYFTYKNWLWVYDIAEKKWIQLKENKPGISPYPRNGQLLPIENGTKALLISGIGSDTGIQREHKARLGLASATDVGYFTWLRDAHELDLTNMEWKNILPANQKSLRHEGAMGYIAKLNLVVNYAGNIPSPKFGQEAIVSIDCSIWELKDNSVFKSISFEGDAIPAGGGYFIALPETNWLLYKINEEIYKLELNSFE